MGAEVWEGKCLNKGASSSPYALFRCVSAAVGITFQRNKANMCRNLAPLHLCQYSDVVPSLLTPVGKRILERDGASTLVSSIVLYLTGRLVIQTGTLLTSLLGWGGGGAIDEIACHRGVMSRRDIEV